MAGRSSIALAVAEYLNVAHTRNGSRKSAYPVLIVGPGIVTGDENWPKEIREVIPGAVSRIVDIAARPLPKPARVKDWAKALGIPLDVDGFTGLQAKSAWFKIVEAAQKQDIPLNRELRFALWHTLKQHENGLPASNGAKEEPANWTLLDARIGGYRWLGLGDLPRDPAHEAEMRRRYSLVQFLREYRSGILPGKSFAILSYETAKLGSGRVPAMPTRRMRVYVNEEGRVQKKVIQVCTCPGCGRVVSDEYDEGGQPLAGALITPGKRADQFVGARRRFCQAPAPKWIWNSESGKHERVTHDPDGRPYLCNTPLFSYTGLRREAAARYVQRKARNAFPLVNRG